MLSTSALVVLAVVVLFGLFMATLGWGQFYSRDAGTWAEAEQNERARRRPF